MKIVYFGSGEFGLPTLQALNEQHEVLAVVSQPDRPAGRKRVLTATPIAQWAEAQGLPVYKDEDVNTDEFVQRISEIGADASVVIAFGQKLSPELIGAMGKLAVNLHASLLPKYRGAAPINWAMINGELITGVSVIGLAQRMDAGEVYGTASLEIEPLETAGELHDRLSLLGPDAVLKVLHDLDAGTLAPVTQDHEEATKAPKFKKADGTVDFQLDAYAVRSRVHGLTPWPGCRVNWHCETTGEEKPLILKRIAAMPDVSCFPPLPGAGVKDQGYPEPGMVLEGLRVAVGGGESIRLLEVQAAGTKVMNAEAFSKGYHLKPGDRLSMLDA
ncbi:methionyl-tRNA formyltransferase [Poriferisphaera sp. WC338]|uniref:methionyl-tRNA formyltransferase n=1 Tax=Poriferisphaera sp. WC338 TaxID=3425129 RepID=UPI003D8145CE